MIQAAYTLRIALKDLSIDQKWIGWLCPDCMPPELKGEPQAVPRRKLEHPACPKCGGDVIIDGDRFRCAGLDGESNRERTVAELRARKKDKLLTLSGRADRATHAEFREQQRRMLDELPAVVPRLKPCGREGPIGDLVSEQSWRRRPRAKRG